MATQAAPVDVVASVRRLAITLERWRTAFAHRYGLADNDSIVMTHLSTADGRLLPRKIAALMRLRTGTVTAMLDRLERVGFVDRVPNPDDRRSTFVDLTERGRAALAETFSLLETRVRAEIPETVHDQLAGYLDDIASIVAEVVDTVASADAK